MLVKKSTCWSLKSNSDKPHLKRASNLPCYYKQRLSGHSDWSGFLYIWHLLHSSFQPAKWQIRSQRGCSTCSIAPFKYSKLYVQEISQCVYDYFFVAILLLNLRLCHKQQQYHCRVVKSSRLPTKITTYLVSISRLLCLALLYEWHFLNKISLDWPLTLTTQPPTSKLSGNPALHCLCKKIFNEQL